MNRPLNVLHVCDHLGWDGSRMHGVKRLFGWMIPRFDPDRFRLSLVSLRKSDLSEETLDALGVDITYLERSKFDPRTLRALLHVIDTKQIDILHLHGYGATTFGRLAGAMRRNSHDRARTRESHRHAVVSEDRRSNARAVRPTSRWPCLESTADFVIRARQIPASKVKVVYLGAPLEEFSRPRTAEEIDGARRELGIAAGEFAIGTVTRLHESKGNSYLIDAAARVVRDVRPHGSFWSAKVRCSPTCRRRRRRSVCGARFVFRVSAATSPAPCRRSIWCVFPSLWEGTPLTVFETLAMGKPIVASDADGLLDVLTNGRDAVIVPKRNAAALAGAIVAAMDDPGARTRLAEAARRTDSNTTSRCSSARWNGSTTCCTKRRGRRGGAACSPCRSVLSDVERVGMSDPDREAGRRHSGTSSRRGSRWTAFCCSSAWRMAVTIDPVHVGPGIRRRHQGRRGGVRGGLAQRRLRWQSQLRAA